jgi:hypothetical protein
MDTQQWQEHGRALALANKRHQWERADWILEGIALFGDSAYAEAGRIFAGYARGTLIQWAYVARAFPQSIRIDSKHLAFGHYQAVMAVCAQYQHPVGTLSEKEVESLKTQEMRLAWLRKADEGRWTVSALRAAIVQQIPKPEPGTVVPSMPPADLPPPAEPVNVPTFKPNFPLSADGKRKLTLLAKRRQVNPTAIVTVAVEEYLVAHADELHQATEENPHAPTWLGLGYSEAITAYCEVDRAQIPEIRDIYVATQERLKAEAAAHEAEHNANRVIVESEIRPKLYAEIRERKQREEACLLERQSRVLGTIKVATLPLSELFPDDEPLFAQSLQVSMQLEPGDALPDWARELEAA